jgi:CRP-like cAMP-binding protein
MDDTAAMLARAEFLEMCDDEQRRMLAFAGDQQHFGADQVLYRAGEIPSGAFVLLDGVLQVTPQGDGTAPYTIDEPGSVVSAMALILAKPRAVTITAVTEVQVFFVPRHAFMKLVQQSPVLAQRVAERIQADLGSYLEALQPIRNKIKR